MRAKGNLLAVWWKIDVAFFFDEFSYNLNYFL